ncbi:hypothetical protein CHS0354_018463 [Potamilus streckersoni]|uniref:ABC transporter domain-containing protein n=1 Tax=Potamilus streckersoni TaxID=2493646 RepID=A0AAE0WA96_9BIVA|nr:hypothetical protein CHS0354_018463 [Potamilus streckersoni]
MSNNNLGYQAFKFEWVGLTPRLITPVVIYPELEINQIRLNDILTNPASAKLVFYALWDTGAEISCIKPEAVKRLGISETNFVGFTQVTGVNSETQKMPRYKVGGLILPNNVMFEGFDLVESSIASEEADILIGMNLILQEMLQLKNVSLLSKEKPLVQNLSFSVGMGEVLTVMGESGSGKSTLLSWIIGLPQPHITAAQGKIILNGADITDLPPEKRRIGIQFQEHLLFPHMTAEENLKFAAPKLPRAKRQEMIDQAFADTGLDALRRRYPHELSGGEQSRISLMRTLIAGPAVVLLDEPFSKLDVKTRTYIKNFTYQRLKDAGIPALLVTHDISDMPSDDAPKIQIDSP